MNLADCSAELRELPTAASAHAGDPAVSLDGTRIAFASWTEPDGSAEIYTMKFDGSDRQQITPEDDDAWDLHPFWGRQAAS